MLVEKKKSLCGENATCQMRRYLRGCNFMCLICLMCLISLNVPIYARYDSKSWVWQCCHQLEYWQVELNLKQHRRANYVFLSFFISNEPHLKLLLLLYLFICLFTSQFFKKNRFMRPFLFVLSLTFCSISLNVYRWRTLAAFGPACSISTTSKHSARQRLGAATLVRTWRPLMPIMAD